MLTLIYATRDQKASVFLRRYGQVRAYRVMKQAPNTACSYTTTDFNSRSAAFRFIGVSARFNSRAPGSSGACA